LFSLQGFRNFESILNAGQKSKIAHTESIKIIKQIIANVKISYPAKNSSKDTASNEAIISL
jgi:hypothetical protein